MLNARYMAPMKCGDEGGVLPPPQREVSLARALAAKEKRDKLRDDLLAAEREYVEELQAMRDALLHLEAAEK